MGSRWDVPCRIYCSTASRSEVVEGRGSQVVESQNELDGRVRKPSRECNASQNEPGTVELCIVHATFRQTNSGKLVCLRRHISQIEHARRTPLKSARRAAEEARRYIYPYGN
jgi:hypothetical protein